jgi:hypothetical protein
MRRHVPLVLLRALLAYGIVYALPESHFRWGEEYPGDGQNALGMYLTMALIGAVFGLIYFGVGTLLQFGLRRRRSRWTVLVDSALFVLIAGLLVYGGIIAEYECG